MLAAILGVLMYSCSKSDTNNIQTDVQNERHVQNASVPFEVVTEERIFKLQYSPEDDSFLPSEERDLFENFTDSEDLSVFEVKSQPNKLFMFHSEVAFA